ncbi:MAG: M28 family peptidase, partial [Promethearchaeota archaeon]
MNEKNIIVPKKEVILSWIQTVCDMGYRRPGSEADKKVENYFEQLLREFGISDVRREDIEIPLWEPEDWKFFIEINGKKEEIPCYFFVYTEFTAPEGITGELVAVQTGREVDFQKHNVKGKIAVIDFRNPPLSVGPLKKIAYYIHDPDNTLPDTYSHAATFRFLNWDAFYRAYENGAIGVIGILKDHPGGLKEYFYPADDTASDPRPIPGLYLGREEGKKLKKLLRENKDKPVMGTLIQKGKKSKGITFNIMGLIPGKTDDIILVSSHHDAPFNNAVQDASGSAMVLALAKYFAQFPPKTFNKTLLFLFTAGHFYEEIGGKK